MKVLVHIDQYIGAELFPRFPTSRRSRRNNPGRSLPRRRLSAAALARLVRSLEKKHAADRRVKKPKKKQKKTETPADGR